MKKGHLLSFVLSAFLLLTANVLFGQAPTITSFSPISGGVGLTVTITGTNFNTTPANNIVFFGATKATVSVASAISLTVAVPSGASYAPITVLNTGTTLATYSLANFTPTYSPGKASISTGDFAAQSDYTTDTNPHDVAIGDLDGDGKPDLVVTNLGSTTVSVLRNTGSGGSISFADKVDFTTSGTTGKNPLGVAIGDIDGDGKPDLVVANSNSFVISVLRNTSSIGSISFAARVELAAGSHPWYVAIGDIDGDGKPDLAVANNIGNTTASTVSVFRNTSSSSAIAFALKTDYDTELGSRGVVIGDLDGDGKPDLAVTNRGSNNVSVLRNTGLLPGGIFDATSFEPRVNFVTGNSPIHVVIGDLNGDGKPDLAVAAYSSNRVSVLRNTSSGSSITFANRIDLITGNTPNVVAIGDINGDGIPDLAVANEVGTVSVLQNTGSMTFANKVDLPTGTRQRGVAIGDLDGDGLPDLAVANYQANTVSVLRSFPAYTWIGSTSTDWNTFSNWIGSAVPLTSSDVTIPSGTVNSPIVNQASGTPAVCNTLKIESGATLTIAPAKALTVTGLLTNNATSAGLVIQSDATGTGSLIAGSVSGSASSQLWMTTGAWHMVSSPLSGLTGQTVADFLTTNTVIPTYNSSRGMMDYNPASNTWNDFFTNGTAGNMEAGKGFAMRIGASDAAVTFTGSLLAGSATATDLSADFWNCIGNPYTSAIGINSASSSINNFIAANAANLNASYGAIYVWDQPDASNEMTGKYTVINNVPPAFEVQQGQAFFVKMNTTATSVSFTPEMQIHNGNLALKSAEIAWPTIKLITKVGNQSSETVIAFNSAMTKGLDPTYDAGLFKGDSDLVVYSKLVEDNGISFAIQALPNDSYSSLVIPIGVDFKTGGEVVFSAQSLNLPSECKVILEDKVSHTFTDLSKNTYTVSLQANSTVADRFQLHTSTLTTGINPITAGKISAYAIRNAEIRINGEVSKKAVATLYDIQGRVVLIKNLEKGSSNVIRTPNLKTGIYMLFVSDNGNVQRFKLPVNE